MAKRRKKPPFRVLSTRTRRMETAYRPDSAREAEFNLARAICEPADMLRELSRWRERLIREDAAPFDPPEVQELYGRVMTAAEALATEIREMLLEFSLAVR